MPDEKKQKNKSLAIKILAPIAILCAIAGVFLVKTAQKQMQQAKAEQAAQAAQTPLALETLDLNALFEQNLPVMLDFGASWCGPCQSMKPDLEAIHAEAQGKAIVHYIDVDEVQQAADYPIQVVPTQVFYTADGKPYVPSESIGIPFTMYSSKDTNEHVFTVHEGALTQDQMRAILTDMGMKND